MPAFSKRDGCAVHVGLHRQSAFTAISELRERRRLFTRFFSLVSGGVLVQTLWPSLYSVLSGSFIIDDYLFFEF